MDAKNKAVFHRDVYQSLKGVPEVALFVLGRINLMEIPVLLHMLHFWKVKIKETIYSFFGKNTDLKRSLPIQHFLHLLVKTIRINLNRNY